jgi:guanosine-3',5'-bis(diphosphate) 3'-pyrophosphohydrolase
MLQMTQRPERIASVLHDVVEDTPIRLNDLRQAGFSDDIVTAVYALIKRAGQDCLIAAGAVANPIARRVKLADVADNMDLRRIPHPTERDYARL